MDLYLLSSRLITSENIHSFYITSCVFNNIRTRHTLIYIQTRATKITHVCFSNNSHISGSSFTPFLLYNYAKEPTFCEFIYSSASECTRKDTSDMFFFSSDTADHGSYKFQCINVSNSSTQSVLALYELKCATIKMNTVSFLELEYFIRILETKTDTTYCGMNNFIQNVYRLLFINANSYNGYIITIDNCIFSGINNSFGSIFIGSNCKAIVINCVFDRDVNMENNVDTLNCIVINNPTTFNLAHFSTENICLGVSNENAFGCRDGSCPNSKGCPLNAFSFNENDIIYTEKNYPGYNDLNSYTPSFSPSIYFTKSECFSYSSEFTISENFLNTNIFTKTLYFSASSKFTKSKIFKNSNLFSKSDYFSLSIEFTKSNKFSFSNDFTKSKIFTSSESFTLTKSKIFTESKKITKSESFSKSDSFLPTPTQSLHSHYISISGSASLSYIKVRSVNMEYSNYLFNTFLLTNFNGSVFTIETQMLTKTQLYYIIYTLSQTYVPVSIPFEINQSKKKITAEKLMGIVCGSVAVFFLILYIIFFAIKKNQIAEISSVADESSSLNDESQNELVQEVTNISIDVVQNNKIDNWL